MAAHRLTPRSRALLSDDEENDLFEASREDFSRDFDFQSPVRSASPERLCRVVDADRIQERRSPLRRRVARKGDDYGDWPSPTRALRFDARGSPPPPQDDSKVETTEDKKPRTPDRFDEWRRVSDAKSGDTYYYNRRTRESSWALPSEAVVLKVNGTEKIYAPRTLPDDKATVLLSDLKDLTKRQRALRPVVTPERSDAQPAVYCVYCGAVHSLSALKNHLQTCPKRLPKHLEDQLRQTIFDDETTKKSTPTRRVTPSSNAQQQQASSKKNNHPSSRASLQRSPHQQRAAFR